MTKIAIAFLLGCVLCLNLSELPKLGWLLVVLLPPLIWFRQWVLSSLIVGLLWAGLQAELRLEDRLSEQLADQTILVQGLIASIPEQHTHLLRFDFKPENPELPNILRLSWYQPPAMLPAAGETWQFEVKLKPPHGLMNPGGFDYEKWLFSEGIGATGYIRGQSQNIRLSAASLWHPNTLRQRFQQRLNAELVNAKQLPLLLGLAIGQRDALEPTHWDVLRQTGTSHLLAISGLHIGLAAALGFFLFRWAWTFSASALHHLPAKQAGALGGMLFALFYALLAGMSIPTQRALLMVSILMLAIFIRRNIYPTSLLSFSLVAVLLFDPMTVLSAGFWLSYLAVALILLTCSGRYPRNQHYWFWIHLWLALGLMPLVLLFFGQFSLVAPLANLLAVPIVSLLIVPLILIAMIVFPLSQNLSFKLLQLADWALEYLWQWLSWLAELPLVDWQIHFLPPSVLLLMSLMLLLLLLPRGMPARWLSLFALLPLMFYQPDRPKENHVFFTLLDVGQGLAAVIETKHHTLVFDTGPRYSEHFDTGSSVVAPFLLSRGIKTIDTLIVSHADNDHAGGVKGLLATVPADKVLTSSPSLFSDSQACSRGKQWQWDGVSFTILHPESSSTGSRNNQSCVLKVSAANRTILLTGDIEHEAEQSILENDALALKAHILVVPHHGSRTSSTAEFIAAVSPDYALVPVGYRNRYGFPKPDVIERYQAQSSRILRSDKDGAVIFSDRPSPIRWRQQAKKLWTAETTE